MRKYDLPITLLECQLLLALIYADEDLGVGEPSWEKRRAGLKRKLKRQIRAMQKEAGVK